MNVLCPQHPNSGCKHLVSKKLSNNSHKYFFDILENFCYIQQNKLGNIFPKNLYYSYHELQ